MPFFIKHCPKTIWDVYVVEANSREAVENLEYDDDREQLLGDFITPSNENCEIFGPYSTKEEALNDDEAWVENKA